MSASTTLLTQQRGYREAYETHLPESATNLGSGFSSPYKKLTHAMTDVSETH